MPAAQLLRLVCIGSFGRIPSEAEPADRVELPLGFSGLTWLEFGNLMRNSALPGGGCRSVEALAVMRPALVVASAVGSLRWTVCVTAWGLGQMPSQQELDLRRSRPASIQGKAA